GPEVLVGVILLEVGVFRRAQRERRRGVVAERAVRQGRVRAAACPRIADAGAMAVVALSWAWTDDRVRPRARPALAGVGLRARAGVAARRPVRLLRVAAHPGRRVTG